MESLRSTARLAGLYYVLVAILTPFVLLYVPGQLYVAGDASATVAKIAANQHLFVASILVGLFSQVLFVLVILALYRLLKSADEPLAIVMAAFILLQVPLSLVAMSNEVATLQFIRDGAAFSVFSAAEREALIMFMVGVDRQGVLVSQFFWGLWLLPLGILVIRSKFLPSFLGLWLILNGLAYIALTVIGLVTPELRERAFTLAIPLMFGELALALWLLIVGIRVKKQKTADANR